MLIYNPQKTRVYYGIQWSQSFFLHDAAPFAEKVFWFLCFVAVPIFLFYDPILGLGMLFISVSCASSLLSYRIFFENYLSRSEGILPLEKVFNSEDVNDVNVADYFDFDSLMIIKDSKNSFDASNELLENEKALLLFDRVGIDREGIRIIGKSFKDKSSPDIYSVIYESLRVAASKGRKYVSINELFLALVKVEPWFEKILFDADLDFEDLENIVWWEESLSARRKENQKFWSSDTFKSERGFGKEWAMGYTPFLDKFARDMSHGAPGDLESKFHIQGHQKYINEAEKLLSTSGKNNVLLIGQPGVGKRSIAYGLAGKVNLGRTLAPLRFKRVMALDMGAILAGLTTPGEIEERFRRLLVESASAGNIILYIDSIHNIIGSESGVGKVDVSEVLIPFISRTDFQLIASTTYRRFHENIEINESINALFKKMEIQPANGRETILVLEELSPEMEATYGVKISYKALKQIVFLTDKYIQSDPFPQKAIDLMQEVFVYAASESGGKYILPDHVNKVFSKRVNIPVGEIEEKEKDKLLNLENFIHQRVINQEEAVKVISEAMRRARTGTREVGRPIGSFMFLGPTGVGKTETAKALAEAYFGSDKNMIRMDMSEYQEISSISRLIGGNHSSGQLTSAVLEKPFSLVLFDEVEKAHPDILNLFLQILDEGWITDGWGRKIYFSNTIIICTSNAGAEFIRQSLLAHKPAEQFKNELLDFLQSKALFKPELLNRFDSVVTFKPLSQDHLRLIAGLMINKLASRLAVEKDLKLVVSDATLEKVVQLGYDPVFGARPMRRVIQEHIENIVADKILRGEAERGQVLRI